MSDVESQSQLEELVDAVTDMMNNAWREPGFCVPNPTTYPYQWLWDSCFHAVIWAHLNDSRCVTELESLLAHQHDDGFVPHMTYWGDPDAGKEFWGSSMVSTITQPPIYGHCFAELVRRGFEPDPALATKAQAGLANLCRRQRTATGLVPIWHPWESGCDDSPRWDDWAISDWRQIKSDLVFNAELNSAGAIVGSSFSVGSVGFNALIAWNISELAAVEASTPELDFARTELAELLAQRWDEKLGTWTDSDRGSGKIRTADSMLCALVDPRPQAFAELMNPDGFGAKFGPRGVHAGEPTFDPDIYWRGPSWPQLNYLLYLAAKDLGHDSADGLGRSLVAGASQSGLAEYWNPETGAGRGAAPQSWAGLAVVIADDLAD